MGDIQNGLATARQAVLEALLADCPTGVTIGAAQVVAGAARIVLAILLPFRGQLFRGAEGGRQLAHLAEVVAVGLGEAQQDAPGHAMREVVGHDISLIPRAARRRCSPWPIPTCVPARRPRSGFPARGAPDPPWPAPGRKPHWPAERIDTGPRSWTDPRETPYWGASG